MIRYVATANYRCKLDDIKGLAQGIATTEKGAQLQAYDKAKASCLIRGGIDEISYKFQEL